MNGIPQLDPLPLAAPAWLFWFLLILTFSLHLVPMSAVLGGSVIGVVARWRGRGGDRHQQELARLTGKLMPVAIAAAVTLGVAALLFLQVLYGRLFFSSSVVMAWFWLSVVPLLIVAYYSAYGVAFRNGGGSRLGLSMLSAAIFLVIAFIYTNNMTLMLQPATQHELHTASARGLALNGGDAMLLPRYLHMLAGAIGVAGLVVAWLGFARRTADRSFADWAVGYGCRWFVVASIVNVAIGTWFLAALPREVMLLFMGRDAAATVVVIAGVVSAAAAVGFAMLASKALRPGAWLGAASGTALVTVVLMVLTRDTVRTAMLGAAGFQPATWAVPQWGPIAIFAVLLVAAIALVAWMVTVLVKAPAAQPAPEALKAEQTV